MRNLFLLPIAALLLGGCIITPFDPGRGIPAISTATHITCRTPDGHKFTTTIQDAENENILDYCAIPHR